MQISNNLPKQNSASTLKQNSSGFTLIEILVVIGLIAILAAIVIIAINPARQFAQGRNTQRTSNVNAILNAIGQNMADNKGIFNCAGLDTNPRNIQKGGSGNVIDLRPCIVPTYMPEIPYDPTDGNNTCTNTACDNSGGSYDTQYTVQLTSTARVMVCAPGGQEAAIPGSAAICVTR